MRRYAAEIFDGANIAYSLEMEEQFATRKLNMEQRRDVFLIFKEALNNIYKHARAKNVSMILKIENKKLHFIITDDGKGFDTGAITSRNGIKNMQQRIDKWQGTFSIQSAPGMGTKTAFILPV